MSFDWDKLRTFYLVAETGSFTNAMKKLNLSQSAISRQISSLEERMGTVLFHRHARGVVLTEQGRILYDTAMDVYNKINRTEEQILEFTDRPSGVLKVNTSVSLGSMWLAPIASEFKELYPDIELHLICTDKGMDLSMMEADMAVTMHKTTSPGLIQKRLLHNNIYAYASVEYLERKGRPQTHEDLRMHNLIVYDQSIEDDKYLNLNWLLKMGQTEFIEKRPYLTINNFHGMYRMVRSGAGIAALPEFMESLPGAMEKVLPDEKGPEFDIYVMYPEEYRKVQKVQLFKDFLVEKTKV